MNYQTQKINKMMYESISSKDNFGLEMCEIDIVNNIAVIPDNHVIWIYKVRKLKSGKYKRVKILAIITKSQMERVIKA